MSKDNLFLGMARGSVGDVVFSRFGGQQVARARNRSPKNPRSWLQLCQRVVMKTVMQSYSLMQSITNHSFQGFAEGTACQSHYVKLNVDALRERIAAYIESEQPQTIAELNNVFNFAQKGTTIPLLNPYIVSEGTISPISTSWAVSQASSPMLMLGSNDLNANSLITTSSSYAHVAEALGLQAGDQITLVGVSINGAATIGDADAGKILGFAYARIILSPSDGDMSKKFFEATGSSIIGINDPNPDNENTENIYWGVKDADGSGVGAVLLPLGLGLSSNPTMGAGAWIASRYNNGVWERSTQSLVVREGEGADLPSVSGSPMLIYDLASAIQSFMSDPTSTLYLNGADANQSL